MMNIALFGLLVFFYYDLWITNRNLGSLNQRVGGLMQDLFSKIEDLESRIEELTEQHETSDVEKMTDRDWMSLDSDIKYSGLKKTGTKG